MLNKNKTIIGPDRLVYMAEVQRFGEGEIASVKAKKEEGEPELDTAGMVAEANKVIDDHEDQLAAIPVVPGKGSFTDKLHNELVNYFVQSPDRYDKNSKKGLNAQEFANYRTEMVQKTEEMVKEYAPTEEELRIMDATKKNAEKAASQAESFTPLDPKDVTDDPGVIKDMNDLGDKFTAYNGWNAALQQESMQVIQASGEVQKAYAAFQESRSGMNAYRRLTEYFTTEMDDFKAKLQRKIDDAKSKLESVTGKFDQTKKSLEQYGAGLAKGSNKSREDMTKERDDLVDKMEHGQKETDKEKKEKEDAYKKLSAQQKAMEEQEQKLGTYANKISQGQKATKDQKGEIEKKRDDLSNCEGQLKSSLEKVEDALKNPDLSDEEKATLESARKTIEEKLGEVGTGARSAKDLADHAGKKLEDLGDAERALAVKSFTLKSHLEGQVMPALGSLSTSIAALEAAKIKYATTLPQVQEHYDIVFNQLDDVDGKVDDAVLKNNLANEQMVNSLNDQKNSLDKMDLTPPTLLEATLGTLIIPFETVAGLIGEAGKGITAVGEWCLDQANWMMNEINDLKDDWSKSVLGTIAFGAAWLGGQAVSIFIGTAGGVIDMAGGLCGMVNHPGDAVAGLVSLIGRNPATGEWSAGTAGEAWKGFAKGLISYDDFKKGRIGVGIGKIFVNIATMESAVKGGAKGFQAAKGMYTAAREGGAGVMRSLGKAGVAGTKAGAKAFVGEFTEPVAKAAGGVVKGAKTVGRGIRGAAGEVVEAAGKVRELGVTGLARKGVGAVVEGGKALGRGARGAAETVGSGVKAAGKEVARKVKTTVANQINEFKNVNELPKSIQDNVPVYRAVKKEYAGLPSKRGENYWSIGSKNKEYSMNFVRDNPDYVLMESTIGDLRKAGEVDIHASGDKLYLRKITDKPAFRVVAESRPAEEAVAAGGKPDFAKRVKEAGKAVGRGAKSAYEGAASQAERVWGGKSYEGVRAAKGVANEGKQISNLAGKEAALAEDIGKNAKRYEQFGERVNAVKTELKKEFPGLDDEGLTKKARVRVGEKDPALLGESFSHEKNLQELENVREKMDALATADAGADLAADTVGRQKGLRDVMDKNRNGYSAFKEALEKGDQKALELQKQLDEVFRTGDPEALTAWKEFNAHKLPEEWKQAIDFMEARQKYGTSIFEIGVANNLAATKKRIESFNGDEVKIRQFLDSLQDRGIQIPPGETKMIYKFPDGQKAVVLVEDGSFRIIDKSAMDSKYWGAFAEDIPDSLKAEGKISISVGGFIDETGQIHYNSKYFEFKHGVKMTMEDGKKVFEVNGKKMKPYEFFRTDKGKAVLNDMKRIRQHEVTHRYIERLNNVVKGELINDLRNLIEGDPAIKKNFAETGRELNDRNLQEFIAEVSEGKTGLAPEDISKIETAVQKYAKGFTFNKVRSMDNAVLALSNEADLARAFVDAAETFKRGPDLIKYDETVNMWRDSKENFVPPPEPWELEVEELIYGKANIQDVPKVKVGDSIGEFYLVHADAEKNVYVLARETPAKYQEMQARRDARHEWNRPFELSEDQMKQVMERGGKVPADELTKMSDEYLAQRLRARVRNAEKPVVNKVFNDGDEVPILRNSKANELYKLKIKINPDGTITARGMLLIDGEWKIGKRSYANMDELRIAVEKAERAIAERPGSLVEEPVIDLVKPGPKKTMEAGRISGRDIKIPGYKYDGYEIATFDLQTRSVIVIKMESRGEMLSQEISIDELAQALRESRENVEMPPINVNDPVTILKGNGTLRKGWVVEKMGKEKGTVWIKGNKKVTVNGVEEIQPSHKLYPKKLLQKEMLDTQAALPYWKNKFELMSTPSGEPSTDWVLKKVDPKTGEVTVANLRTGEIRNVESIDHMIVEAEFAAKKHADIIKRKQKELARPRPLPKPSPAQHLKYTNVDADIVHGYQEYGIPKITSKSDKVDGGVFMPKKVKTVEEAVVVNTRDDRILSNYINECIKELRGHDSAWFKKLDTENILKYVAEKIQKDFPYDHNMNIESFAFAKYTPGQPYPLGMFMENENMVCRHMGLLAKVTIEKIMEDPVLRKHFPEGFRSNFMGESQHLEAKDPSGHAYAIMSYPTPNGPRYFSLDPANGVKPFHELGLDLSNINMNSSDQRYLFSLVRTMVDNYDNPNYEKFIADCFRNEGKNPALMKIVRDAVNASSNTEAAGKIRKMRRQMGLSMDDFQPVT